MIKSLLEYYNFDKKDKSGRAAIFISGTGSNAERLLETREKTSGSKWTPAVIVTDFPEKSRASEIARRFGLPLAALSIKDFYLKHGEKKFLLKIRYITPIKKCWRQRIK